MAFICRAGKTDSILTVLNAYVKEDTNKVNLLFQAGISFKNEKNFSEAIDYFSRSARLASKINFKTGEGLAYKKIGDVYLHINENVRAKEYYNKALVLFKQSEALYQIAITLNCLGNLEETAGDYNEALKHYLSYLDYSEKINSKYDIAIAYNNMAIIYADMNDLKKELAYNFKALKIRETLNDKWQLAASYNNIGVAYQNVDHYELAIPYYNKALELRTKINDTAGVAAVYHNLAICYKYSGDIKRAEKFYLEALETQKKLNDKSEVALTYINLGRFYSELGQFNKCLNYLNGALQLTTTLGLTGYRADVHESLYEAYHAMKKPSEALFHFQKYIELRDSLNNVEQSKEFTRIEMQNKFDKETSVRQAEQTKKDALQKQQQLQQKIITISISVLLLIITVFLFFVYRSYKQKQQANVIITQQKQEVESQKHLIEEKQKEIIDSINYAKRIQSAILAREEDIKNFFPESFLLYKPKDIVAGDFYYFETTATHVFYAAADCTGHGVPGALVSVVCSNALSRCVKEFNLYDPGKILDKTRDLVLDTLKKSGQDVKDGMDISLLVKDRQTGNYFWAGANNPLWFIKDGIKEISEITANKQPIGLSDSPAPFTTHKLNINAGDRLFLFTDGYADQFGGPKGKKFKYKQLENLLVSISAKDVDKQKKLLNSTFENWRNGHEQVDDVLIIGIKV